jgi:transposase
MSEPIHAEYQQLLLLPRSVEEWVGPQHVARFIRDFVDLLDLASLGFEVGAPATGCPGYADELLLKVWLYGYLEKVRSTRRLEEACSERMGLIWLSGQQQPDHNTLWRFWRAHRGTLRQLFKQIVHLAAAANLVGVALHAVDGTKIAARASRHGVRTRAALAAMLQELDAAVDEVMAQVEATEAGARESATLPPEWQDTVRRRERLRELLGRMEASGQQSGQPSEPEARPMKTAGGTVPGYNAQLAVDERSGLIVGQAVVTEPDDTYQLVGMIERVEATLGQAVAQTVADAGYHAPQALATAAARGYEVLVNESPQRAPAPEAPGSEFHAARFRYEAGRDVCVCPRGEELRLERYASGRQHRAPVRVYRCTRFRDCPVRWQCSRDQRGRTIDIGEHHAVVVAQREARAVPENRARLRQRSAIVEGPIGIIKQVMEFRRWTVAGHENVAAQWTWVCSAFNLRKLYALWRRGQFVLA